MTDDRRLLIVSLFLLFACSSSDGSRPATPAAIGEEAEGRVSVASRRFTPAPPILEENPVDAIEETQPQQEQTTLLHDEEESFALAPVDASALKGRLEEAAISEGNSFLIGELFSLRIHQGQT